MPDGSWEFPIEYEIPANPVPEAKHKVSKPSHDAPLSMSVHRLGDGRGGRAQCTYAIRGLLGDQ